MTPIAETSPPPVYLLGAGFSKAIAPSMPTLRELAKAVRVPGLTLPTHFDPDDLESWLSYLAEDKPWADEGELLAHRAQYWNAASAIGAEIARHEHAARQSPIPYWLAHLIHTWHDQRATVITFNYDTLVEAAAAEALRLRSGNHVEPPSGDSLYSVPLTPIGARRGAAFASSPIDSFRLLKLHGSVNWHYSGRSTYYGETIYHSARGDDGWSPRDSDWAAPLLIDKRPLIVPPTLGKSGFFANEAVRGQWRVARNALSAASDVYIVGYSLPATDTLVTDLLRASCSEGAAIHVVNPDRGVTQRVRAVLPRCTLSPASDQGSGGVRDLAKCACGDLIREIRTDT